jgi:prepilin-type processing-associated H-X9-DG protein
VIPGGAAKQVIPTFICPSDILPRQCAAGYGKSNYCGNIGSTITWSGNIATPPTTWPYNFTGNNANATRQIGILLYARNNDQTWVCTFADIIDGTSNTIFVGEATVGRNARPNNNGDGAFPIWAGAYPGTRDWDDFLGLGSWMRIADGNYFPINAPKTTDNSDLCFGSMHPGGANFLFADGTVRFIAEDISALMYNAIASRNLSETTLPTNW